MGFPASVTTVTVTGRWRYADGSTGIPTGTVTFTPNATLQVPADDDVLPPRPLVAVLDNAGQISVTLMSTADPDVAPTGWAYDVVESIGGRARSYAAQFPALTPGQTYDLADITPAASVPAFSYVLTASVGVANGVASLDSGGQVPLAQLGHAPSGAVASVNGQTGVVVLTAGNVGADAAGAAAAVLATSLQKASNLSDVANAGTARTNLGLGTAATQASSAFDAAGAAAAAQAASQPLDSDLTAFAALAAAGFVVRTGSGTVSARTLTALDASIAVAQGDGVAGNPTIGTSLSAILGVATSAGSHKITSLTDPTAAQDAATKLYVDTGAYAAPVALNTAGGSFGTNVSAGSPAPTAQNGPGSRTWLAGAILLAASQVFNANSILATLPTAQRPAALGRWTVRTIGSNSQTVIAVDTDGTVKNLSAVTAGGSGDTLALDPVSFVHA